MAETQPDLWIFAYGSLMWRPDFSFSERHRARIDGYRRALCIYSHHYRGTEDHPGLVFGLSAGGTCTGIAYRIAPADRDAVLEAVRIRELITSVYLEITAPVLLDSGQTVTAITYVADADHPQFAGDLSQDKMLQIVLTAEGVAGRNVDYVWNTQRHLVELGVDDPDLSRLCAALEVASESSAPVALSGTTVSS